MSHAAKAKLTMFKLLFTAVLFAAPFAHADQQSRPNIIVVMSDDHGQWAMGAYGLDEIQTPNLDWLADQGVLFRNSMSPAPVCSPARASFYTGKMPSQHGVHDFLRDDRAYDAGWLKGETLLSERVKASGYRTALLGKWHATTDGRPPQPGFDRWVSYNALEVGWENQYMHSGKVHFSSDGEPLAHTGVQARFLTEEAIRFIDEPSSKPFFISLNLVEPHAPFAGLPERLVSNYRGLASKVAPYGDTSDLADRGKATTTPDDHDEKLAQYLAAVSLIDEQIGRLLDALQGRDLLDNTIVVYTSDHGLLVGQYGLYGKTNATNPQNFYEETIRIPLIVYGPAQYLRAPQVRSEFVDLIDLHTTILDFASGGQETHSDYGPGRSFRRMLQGQRNNDWRSVQISERGRARMITDGRWKLVRYYHRDAATAPSDFWYDLTHPLGERRASAAPQAHIITQLTTTMSEFFERFETVEHSGRNVWSQAPPNPRVCKDLEIECPKP